MNEKQEKFLESVPQSSVRIVTRAFERTGGRANAIKAFCLVCLGFSRNDIRECTAHTCPLHPWRPFQKATPGDVTPDDDTFDIDQDQEDDDDTFAIDVDEDDEL